ncbi:MAG: SurA N-terminal domain-containing protein [Spirochaetaceae bacterium]|nr:SurA N-terminal domain-containing protein [Spirochaetaceae bacterium]
MQRDDSATSELVRRFKANPLVFIGTVVVLVIVIVAFVFVPAIVPSAGGFGGDLSFGSYNNIPIAYAPGNYLAQTREQILWNYQNYYRSLGLAGMPLPEKRIWQQAFEETVVHTAILDEMKRAGYTAPAKIVDRKVAELPQFQENGVFSVARYRALNQTDRMSLWRQMQESLAEDHYRNDVTGVKISSKETAFITAMGSRQRNFDMVSFSLRDYPETEIKTYMDANVQLFSAARLSQITLLSSEREARQVLSSIQDGTITFEDAARTHSKDSYAEKGGDSGVRMSYEFTVFIPDAQERDALMKLGKGELSGLVKVKLNDQDGWAFFRAEEEPRQADIGDPSILGKIRDYIMTFERGEVENYYIQKAESLTAEVQDSDLAEFLEAREMKKQSFGPIPLNYGNTPLFNTLSAQGIASDAAYNQNFWQTAFAIPARTFSKPLVVGDTVVVLYPTEDITEDEKNIQERENAYPSQVSQFMDVNIRDYFIKSPKLVERFEESYAKYLQPIL